MKENPILESDRMFAEGIVEDLIRTREECGETFYAETLGERMVEAFIMLKDTTGVSYSSEGRALIQAILPLLNDVQEDEKLSQAFLDGMIDALTQRESLTGLKSFKFNIK